MPQSISHLVVIHSNFNNTIINQNIEEFLGPTAQTLPKLQPSETNKMEGHLTVEEMAKYLKKLISKSSH